MFNTRCLTLFNISVGIGKRVVGVIKSNIMSKPDKFSQGAEGVQSRDEKSTKLLQTSAERES